MADLGSVIIGGLIAVIGGFSAKYWEDYKRRISLRSAFRAEIKSILSISETRHHEERYRVVLTNLKAGNRNLPIIIGAEEIQIDPVFDRNVDKIGELRADVAGDITEFYGIIHGLRLDLRAVALGKLNNWSTEDLINLIEQDLKMWDRAKELGQQLLGRL